jgi:hypothetical protein
LLGLHFSLLDLDCLIILCPHRGSLVGLNFSLLDLG